MEPGSTLSSPSPETGAYHAPESPKSPELASERTKTPEKAPISVESRESNKQPGSGPPVFASPLQQLPTLPAPQAGPAPLQAQTDENSPLVAADEDLVEKEWVDKAKKIVADTKDDPYKQEKEVSKLQADYLKKRYGKELKLSSE